MSKYSVVSIRKALSTPAREINGHEPFHRKGKEERSGALKVRSSLCHPKNDVERIRSQRLTKLLCRSPEQKLLVRNFD